MDADQWLELEASLCANATSKLSVALKEAFPAVTSNYLGTCYPVAMLKAVQWCAAGNASASESPFGELQKRALQDGLDRWQFSVLVLHSTLAVLLLMCAFVLVPLLQFGWLYLRNVPGDGAFVLISPRGNEGGRVSEMPVLLA
ncbi:hypothetical protein Poli38472_014658 [Pythium oligandrum]|uniref:Uncharacterized protein n=1 Tax=Pythium oligandrum TaxID=41045 RepID=A0A8K1CKB9_PYTOL|nr:hypothetical protein Poli38472_014658 [Pythium oligandrum]|eukprot:TMW63953.1 hypothetical protein Poli38472_014658 [Pythium oligandrum]